MKDPLRYFRVEARDLARVMSMDILELEGEAPDRDEIAAKLLRAAHTLKGAARVVGEAEIAALAHAFEDAIAIGTFAEDVPDLLARVDAIIARVARLAEAPRTESPPSRAGRDDLELALLAIADARRSASTVRRAAAGLAPPGAQATRAIDAALASLDAELSRAAAHAHDLRLVPASDIFAELERAARDTARTLGKRIMFEARGGEQHLDRNVLSLTRDALLHVVQNAVDHGIESAAERKAHGKPVLGTITVEIARRGHRATFSCRDDGRGIDVAGVERAAAGRARAGRPAVELVFEAGVSTRSEVSPISGRGIGLDAVREMVARLHGTVSATSEPGRGTTFAIVVPVSLTAMPVLVMESGGARASIPIDAVRTCTALREGSTVSIDDREILITERGTAPLLTLGAWLPDGSPTRPRVALLVEAEGNIAALGVDRLLGAEHVVVLPIASIAGPLPLLGASLDSLGRPVPVLDPSGVVAAARAARRTAALPTARRRVLVIDDSLTSRVLEQSILASAGFDADIASSAEEALEKARLAPYDLFLVDVEMEGMDGFQFVAHTKADPALSATPSIIVSSRESDTDKRRGAACGARAWVVKGELAEPRFIELVRGLSR